jgi:hypothetical protein
VQEVQVVREFPTRKTSDTERGRAIRADIEMLTKLIEAYRTNALRQRSDAKGASTLGDRDVPTIA